MKLFLFVFLISTNFFLSQKVESIYVLTRKNIYSNKYKNHTEKDSIILFKDKTFKRIQIYWGFDEFDNKTYLGEWSFSKRLLLLNLQRKQDSLKDVVINDIQAINRKYLKRKYKKVK